MKKQFKMFVILCIALIALVACNTAEQSTTSPTPAEGTNTSNDTIKNDDGQTGSNTDDDDQVNENVTNSITYTSNGEQKTEETTPVTSSEQQYTIEVIPNFTHTAEEPGKDLLYLTENSSISMRIEHFTRNETTFKDLQSNTVDLMSAVGENVDYTAFDIQSYVKDVPSISNFAAYKVELQDQVVISIVYEKDEQLVRLTIYDDPVADYSDALIKMGLTITHS